VTAAKSTPEPWMDRALAAQGEALRAQPVIEAARVVVDLRRARPEKPAAHFEVVERFHEAGHGGLVVRALSPEAEELVRNASKGEQIEARAFLGERWPGGDLAPALETLEQKLGRYLAHGPETTKRDLVPPSALTPGASTGDDCG
jgi:hypothetical protein